MQNAAFHARRAVNSETEAARRFCLGLKTKGIMPVEFASLLSFDVPITLKDGEGNELIKFTVKRRAISMDEWNSVMGFIQDAKKVKAQPGEAEAPEERRVLYSQEDKAFMVDMIKRLLISWDLVEGGQPVPLERVADLDAAHVQQLYNQVWEHVNPNPKQQPTA